MKKFMFLILVVLVFLVGGASMNLAEAEKSNVVKLPGQSKQQIHQKSKQWIADRFIAGRTTMDYKNPTTGTVIRKGTSLTVLSNAVIGTNPSVYLTCAIDSFNGESVIVITPKHCRIDGSKGPIDCPCTSAYLSPEALAAITVEIDKLISDYRSYMTATK